MCKLTIYVRKCVVLWVNLHSFNTTAGRGGRDKYQLCGPKLLNSVEKVGAAHAFHKKGQNHFWKFPVWFTFERWGVKQYYIEVKKFCSSQQGLLRA